MTSHPSAIMSWKESFMNHWKVAGELVRPKNICNCGLVSLAMIGDPAGIKREPHQIIR